MNEIETTVKHFEALTALSNVNLKISEARNTLIKLEEIETEYLVSRENKAMDRIKNVLESSKELVAETNKNYEIIKDFARSVTQSSNFLTEAHKSFSELIDEKDKYYQSWEKDIKNQEEAIVQIQNGLKIQMTAVESGKKQIEVGKSNLETERRKIEDMRGRLQQTIRRFNIKK